MKRPSSTPPPSRRGGSRPGVPPDLVTLLRGASGKLALWSALTGATLGAAASLGLAPAEGAVSTAHVAVTSVTCALMGLVGALAARGPLENRVRRLARRMEGASERARRRGGEALVREPVWPFRAEPADAVAACGKAYDELARAFAEAGAAGRSTMRLTEAIGDPAEVTVVAQRALGELLAASQAQAGAVIVARDGNLVAAADQGLAGATALADWMPVRRVLGSEGPLRLETSDPAVQPPPPAAKWSGRSAAAKRHVLVTPIPVGKASIGAIVLVSATPLAPELERTLEPLRAVLGFALKSALAAERVERAAALDPLTGLWSRRFGMRRLREELQRALRSGTSVGVLLLDVDHFRSINETYGQVMGDRVLVHVAQAARRALRESDVLVRHGGDELLVVLPDATREDTRRIAERLRAAVARTPISDGGETVHVTVSVGGNAFPHDPVSGDEALVSHTEEALQLAKRAGHDRVEMTPPAFFEACFARATA